MSWSTSELRVRLAPLNRFKPSSKIFYWPFQGGTSFVDLLCFCSVLCLLCFVRVCLYVLCGHLLGKGWPLGSRLWCLLWVCHFPIGILGQVWYLIVSIPDLCTITYFYLYVHIHYWRLLTLTIIIIWGMHFGVYHEENYVVRWSRTSSKFPLRPLAQYKRSVIQAYFILNAMFYTISIFKQIRTKKINIQRLKILILLLDYSGRAKTSENWPITPPHQ